MNNQAPQAHFPNKAGDHADTNAILTAELHAAGIPTIFDQFNWDSRNSETPKNYTLETWQESHYATLFRNSSGEVKTSITGFLYGWKFERAWYYWTATGPGIPPDAAMKLHETHGKDVRVAGHCGCPSPLEWYKGMAVPNYHIDTPDGLKALADLIRSICQKHIPPQDWLPMFGESNSRIEESNRPGS